MGYCHTCDPLSVRTLQGYPLPKHLEAVVDHSQYAGQPYALALALGEPQLTRHAFDLAVLEPYGGYL